MVWTDRNAVLGHITCMKDWIISEYCEALTMLSSEICAPSPLPCVHTAFATINECILKWVPLLCLWELPLISDTIVGPADKSTAIKQGRRDGKRKQKTLHVVVLCWNFDLIQHWFLPASLFFSPLKISARPCVLREDAIGSGVLQTNKRSIDCAHLASSHYVISEVSWCSRSTQQAVWYLSIVPGEVMRKSVWTSI